MSYYKASQAFEHYIVVLQAKYLKGIPAANNKLSDLKRDRNKKITDSVAAWNTALEITSMVNDYKPKAEGLTVEEEAISKSLVLYAAAQKDAKSRFRAHSNSRTFAQAVAESGFYLGKATNSKNINPLDRLFDQLLKTNNSDRAYYLITKILDFIDISFDFGKLCDDFIRMSSGNANQKKVIIQWARDYKYKTIELNQPKAKK